MFSAVDICNMALITLGKPEIQSFTESNVNAARSKRVYQYELARLLSQHDWSFARKVTKLAQLTETKIDSPFSYYYAIPDDALRPLKVVDTNNNFIVAEFYQNEEIHCDQESDVFLKYTYNIEDPDKMTVGFQSVLSSAIAAKLSLMVRQEIGFRRQLLEEHLIMLEEEKLKDAHMTEDYRDSQLSPEGEPWLTS